MSTPESNRHASSLTRRRRLGVGALAVLVVAAATIIVRRAPADTVVVDPGLHVEANLAQRTLTLRAGDRKIATYPVAVGSPRYPTPRGEYRIRKVIWNPAWIPPDSKWAKDKEPQEPGAHKNPMKVVKIFFREPDYYIHGTGDTDSLGDAASHGCLRMDPDDAYRVARYIMEHGGSPRDEAWYKRVLKIRSQTKTVYLDNPIPMTVD